MSVSPAGWYPDPEGAPGQRYWDGTQWTSHVAPGVANAARSQRKGGLPGWGIALIIVGGGVLVLAILTAMAIPVFLGQQDKAQEQAALDSLQRLSLELATLGVDHPNETPWVGAMGSAVLIEYPDGTAELVDLNQGVAFGGYEDSGSGEWCVWVTTGTAADESWQYTTVNGVAQGSC